MKCTGRESGGVQTLTSVTDCLLVWTALVWAEGGAVLVPADVSQLSLGLEADCDLLQHKPSTSAWMPRQNVPSCAVTLCHVGEGTHCAVLCRGQWDAAEGHGHLGCWVAALHPLKAAATFLIPVTVCSARIHFYMDIVTLLCTFFPQNTSCNLKPSFEMQTTPFPDYIKERVLLVLLTRSIFSSSYQYWISAFLFLVNCQQVPVETQCRRCRWLSPQWSVPWRPPVLPRASGSAVPIIATACGHVLWATHRGRLLCPSGTWGCCRPHSDLGGHSHSDRPL